MKVHTAKPVVINTFALAAFWIMNEYLNAVSSLGYLRSCPIHESKNMEFSFSRLAMIMSSKV